MTFTLPQTGEELSRVLAVLDDFEALAARGLIDASVNDLGEVRVGLTLAGSAAVRAGDGTQPPSGLRGDPAAPRTVTADTRDPSSVED